VQWIYGRRRSLLRWRLVSSPVSLRMINVLICGRSLYMEKGKRRTLLEVLFLLVVPTLPLKVSFHSYFFNSEVRFRLLKLTFLPFFLLTPVLSYKFLRFSIRPLHFHLSTIQCHRQRHRFSQRSRHFELIQFDNRICQRRLSPSRFHHHVFSHFHSCPIPHSFRCTSPLDHRSSQCVRSFPLFMLT
jgi:hypothetical protein